MKILLPAFLLLFLYYCASEVKDEKQKYHIPSDKIALILVDMHLADATLNIVNLNQQVKNFKPEGYYNEILKKYRYSRKELELSIDYYSRHPEEFDIVYEKVLNRLSILEGNISQSKTNAP
ncbi:MAG: DUF4296 domain-containing protein [Bacteroidia bacterium]|nr:DUF4296 domain-containing protein [Bacteroidia bacterium]